MTDDIKNFEDAKRVLLTLPNQCTGRPMAICETGEHYKEIRLQVLARPADVGVVAALLSKEFVRTVMSYLDDRQGTIYWRIKPEFAIEPYQVFQFYSENGPDKDFLIDKLGYADKNWFSLGAYCRLCRSEKPAVFEEYAA